eukprot:CAMPEP_0202494244 /NCGR_PEP_ID=MMETSP1361-20130828/11061_1 /ASSEMBLY_ACC=CAM_ASM_000849 /TAXON_ID=210615 /ORGANISM="Staurosira complex sp., Strain CCMP2646" /LENGTH=73 /DNA_ID=CAMNT_0049124673 /DNA_START=6 /DNA_END=223 /DNA_ORIENTATION=-
MLGARLVSRRYLASCNGRLLAYHTRIIGSAATTLAASRPLQSAIDPSSSPALMLVRTMASKKKKKNSGGGGGG